MILLGLNKLNRGQKYKKFWQNFQKTDNSSKKNVFICWNSKIKLSLRRYFWYEKCRNFDKNDMKRKIQDILARWNGQEKPLPLMLLGARQTGKTADQIYVWNCGTRQ